MSNNIKNTDSRVKQKLSIILYEFWILKEKAAGIEIERPLADEV